MQLLLPLEKVLRVLLCSKFMAIFQEIVRKSSFFIKCTPQALHVYKIQHRIQIWPLKRIKKLIKEAL